jgi:hypothetical protein
MGSSYDKYPGHKWLLIHTKSPTRSCSSFSSFGGIYELGQFVWQHILHETIVTIVSQNQRALCKDKACILGRHTLQYFTRYKSILWYTCNEIVKFKSMKLKHSNNHVTEVSYTAYKVKFLCTSWRHMWGVEVKVHALTSERDRAVVNFMPWLL